jgi:asparagine synthase (glutamine-hydrolysing)
MPGIVGIFEKSPGLHSERLVRTMLESLKHEPSYQFGLYSVPGMHCTLGWVAHPGTHAAKLSSVASNRRLGCVCSGEWYGTYGDESEWLAEVYRCTADTFPATLNGVFSGVLVDAAARRALLFNDRFGLDRLYVYEDADRFYFASEAKALLAVLPATRAFDESAVAELIAFGCPLECKTIFRGIRLLEGGSRVTFEDRRLRIGCYFEPKEWEALPVLPDAEFESRFQETFKRILPRYCNGTSELGISLTGGLDTRMIMACLPPAPPKQVSYTFAGVSGETRDDRLAATVASLCGLPHRPLRLGDEFFADHRVFVDRTVYVTDGCAGAMTAHEIYLNSSARSLAPVRLTGNFGSEVLRGVSTLKPRKLSTEIFQSDFQSIVRATEAERSTATPHPVTFAAFKDIPWRLFGTLAAAKSQITFRTPYLDNEIVALGYQASPLLRQSAGPSTRLIGAMNRKLADVPTDRSVLDRRWPVLNVMPRLIAEVTFKLDYLYTEGLPATASWFDSIAGVFKATGMLGQHKFLNYRRWYRTVLARYISEVTGDPRIRRVPFFNPRVVATMAKDHIEGRRNYVRELDAVLMLEAADRLLLKR